MGRQKPERRFGNMNRQPLVSIITIFWNAERFLSEAIGSVLSQSYPHWELLLVDDGSTDASTDIALRYAEENPKQIRYLEHESHQNRGMSASRNLGISQAQGDYVTMLDSDDVWFPRKLEQQVEILASHPEVALIFGKLQYWWSWTKRPEDAFRDYVLESAIAADTVVKPPSLLMVHSNGMGLNPGSAVMFRREMAQRIGGFENAFKGMFEDQVFLVKAFLNETAYVSSECWTRYRQHPNSAVSTAINSGQDVSSWVQFYEWCEQYLLKHGMQGTPVYEAVRKALRRHRHPIVYRSCSLLRLLVRRMTPAPVRRRWKHFRDRAPVE
jgi:glycosyltransferase involved in cell wall biosynthesis